MIQRTETVNIKPTSREIEQEIWNMDSTEQVDLLLAMSQRYKKETGNVLFQVYVVSEDLKEILDAEERRDVIRLFEQIVVYLKEDEE